MDFRGSISTARFHTVEAIHLLDRYDHAQSPDSVDNRATIEDARRRISPGATSAGADALDAARWERWVTIRQIRETGHALELLDRAWWALGTGQPDIAHARRVLVDAVNMLDSAARGGRWIAQPAGAVPAFSAA